MGFFDDRRARVLPEYAWLYPEITPGVWVRATKAALWVRQAEAFRHREHACACDRPMCECHFEFRGGSRGRRLGWVLDRGTSRRLHLWADHPEFRDDLASHEYG